MMLLTTDVLDAVQNIEAVQNLGKFDQWLGDLLPAALNFGVRLILALILYFVGVKLIKLIRKIVSASMRKASLDEGVIQFTDSVLKALLFIILVLIVVSQFGIDTTSVIAVAGTAGVTVGLALQGSLANLAGGVLILVLKPFKVGDYIVQSGLEGTVKNISMFNTTLLTVDNRSVVIPNGSLANSSLVNVSANPDRQMDIEVGISYESDIKKAKSVIQGLIDSHPTIMQDRPSLVVVTDLADSAVVLKIRFWVAAENYWSVRWEMLENIKEALDANGVSIPYNQLDVHLDQLNK